MTILHVLIDHGNAWYPGGYGHGAAHAAVIPVFRAEGIMAFNVAETDLAGQIRALLFVEPAAEIFYECLRIAFAEALHHVVAEREIVEAVADGTEDVGASFGERGGRGIEFA